MATPIYICEDVRRSRSLLSGLLSSDYVRRPIREHLDDMAAIIQDAHAAGDDSACIHIRCWHPTMVGRPTDQIMAGRLTISDARETVAREHGFADWTNVHELNNGDFCILGL